MFTGSRSDLLQVLYSSPEEGEREYQPAVSGRDNSVALQGLRPGTMYNIKVIPMKGRNPVRTLEAFNNYPWGDSAHWYDLSKFNLAFQASQLDNRVESLS